MAGKIILGLGLILIAASLLLTLRNKLEDRRAGEASRDIRNELTDAINNGIAVTIPAAFAADSSEGAIQEGVFPVDPDLPNKFTPMDISLIQGDRYIGILDVPDYELSLPVMENWSYEKLKTAPCRYSGSYKTGSLVICAHNYDHHFGPLRDAPIGTELSFRAVDGKSYSYSVTKIETLEPHEVGYMTDVLGDWDLTLFTCTTGGKQRVAIRCQQTSSN